ncbi:MAG TPA: ACP phosphodiesterase [Pyrinomonadaceae bacterium]|jgi:acyl carrier protein phosphodiesterase
MNHLAHFFLAERAPGAVVGAFLGDFVKGKIAASDFPPPMRREIIVHRRIDAFTDTDEILLGSKNRFVKTRRRFAGIVLDVAFDHFLAVNWTDYAAQNLDEFANFAYRALSANADRFPADFQKILPQMIADDFLAAYRDFARVRFALQRLSARVRGGENMREAFGELAANYDYFQDVFREFFPRLQNFVAETRKNL